MNLTCIYLGISSEYRCSTNLYVSQYSQRDSVKQPLLSAVTAGIGAVGTGTLLSGTCWPRRARGVMLWDEALKMLHSPS